ncbi:MAG: radical SAM/SPASM domain-containing protein [Desulfovibrionaceae bacterium]
MSTTSDGMLKKYVNINADCAALQQERYGDRYGTYREQYALSGRQELIPDFPLYIHFEQTYLCNLRCPSCIQGHRDLKNKYNTGIPLLPLDVYVKVLEECQAHACPSVAMHSIDEPLLVPDIANRIRLAREHGVMEVFMTTNGQLLTDDTANAICEAGLTHILFSTDAATAETYAKVRVRGDFAKTLRAIERIREWKARNNALFPIIRASFVLSRLNQHEEELFIERFGSLVDYIDIQSFYGLGVVNAHLVPDNHTVIDPVDFACSEPFRKVIVRANGDVVPCCSPFGFRMVMGNVNEQSVFEIYNGSKMKNVRESLKTRNFNPVCRECVSNLYCRCE